MGRQMWSRARRIDFGNPTSAMIQKRLRKLVVAPHGAVAQSPRRPVAQSFP
jgi:hypothetical protein